MICDSMQLHVSFLSARPVPVADKTRMQNDQRERPAKDPAPQTCVAKHVAHSCQTAPNSSSLKVPKVSRDASSSLYIQLLLFFLSPRLLFNESQNVLRI